MIYIAVDTRRSNIAGVAFLMFIFGAGQALLNFFTALTNEYVQVCTAGLAR
jgi:hypothetical protein